MIGARVPLAIITAFGSGLFIGFHSNVPDEEITDIEVTPKVSNNTQVSTIDNISVTQQRQIALPQQQQKNENKKSRKDIIKHSKIAKDSNHDGQLLNLINKFSTNRSISNAENSDAKELTLKIIEYGLPSYSNLCFYSSYCCSLDYIRSTPSWVAEYIT